MYTIYLAATELRVPIGVYIKGIKTAKANLDATFVHGLTGFWSVTGAEIVQQYRQSINERINTKAGESWRNTLTQAEIEASRDARNLHRHLVHKGICRRLTNPKLQKRFEHLLYKDEDW